MIPTRPGIWPMLLVSMLALTGALALACRGARDDAGATRRVETEAVPLAVGCTEVALTWPAGTRLEDVVAAISRPEAVESIWRGEAPDGTSRRFSPDGGAPSDYTVTETAPEPARICMKSAAVLNRPAGTSNRPVVAAAPATVTALPARAAAPSPSPVAGEPHVGRIPPPGAEPAVKAPFGEAAKVGSPSEPRVPLDLLPPGTPLPTEARCAQVVPRTGWEPRPENGDANHTRAGTALTEAVYGLDLKRVTGNFTGTTDEIMHWGACKWGVPVDIVRAIAVQESWWKQSAVGDHGTSFGLLQVKRTAHPGTFPDAYRSTAFNVDYMLSWWRACYEGDFNWWLGADAKGDEWGCVGAWYAGRYRDPPAIFYINLIRGHFLEKPWARPGF